MEFLIMKGKKTICALSIMGMSSLLAAQNTQKTEAKKPVEHYNKVFDQTEMNNAPVWTKAEYLIFKQFISNGLLVANQTGATRDADGFVHQTLNAANYDFRWESGVRVAMGYKIPHDKMDTVAKFTFVQGHAKRNVKGSSNDLLGNFFGTTVSPNSQFGFGNALSESANYRSHLYLVDWELGKHCFPTRWLDLRPLVGLRGFWFKDKSLAQIESTQVEVFPPPNVIVNQTSNTFNWIRGVGIRFGLDTLWNLHRGLSLYANWAATIVGRWSKSQIKQSGYNSTYGAMGDYIQTTETKFGEFDGINELALGFQYDFFFSDDNYHLGFNAGYEYLGFLNSATVFDFFGIYQFQGVSLGMRFDY